MWQKILDRLAIDTLYKTVRAMKGCALQKRNFNVDEQDTQRTLNAMAATRRHVCGRMLSQYFWRQTRTRNVHK
jgi:hypothetical protein